MIHTFKEPSKFIKRLIDRGSVRSIRVKQNILASFLIKSGSVAISFVLVPLTLNYINPTQYGIWLTLSSIINWFSFFDIGLGNGLRNKFAQALAKGEFKLARIFVSTTYALLTIIVIVLSILFFCINKFLDWSKILNTSHSLAEVLSVLALLVFVFFCLRLVLQLITTIMVANQQPGKASFIIFIGSLVSLITIFILTKTTKGNLLYLGTALSLAPCIVLIICSFWLFKTKYRVYAPTIRLIRFRYAKDLLKIGGAFFIIQIGAIVLFQTDTILISQLFGPDDVTTFNITFKLYSVLLLGFAIIITPLWSAYTEAYEKNDMTWIKNIFIKTKKFWFFLIAGTLLLFFTSPIIFKLWIGNSINVPMLLSLTMGMYVIGNSWLMIHCSLLNGISKIRLQLYLYIITIFLNVPLAYFLGKTIGIVGVILSNLLIYIIMGIAFSIQCRKILNCTAKGIWNK